MGCVAACGGKCKILRFATSRASPARTRVTFWSHKKSPKMRRGHPGPRFCPIGLYQWGNFSATEFRFVSNLQFGGQRYSACRPLKGRHVSLGFSPGVWRTSVFAKGENLGARADEPRSRRQLCCLTDAAYPLRVFRPRKSNLEGSPDSPQDWLGGGFQRGRAPFVSSRGWGS